MKFTTYTANSNTIYASHIHVGQFFQAKPFGDNPPADSPLMYWTLNSSLVDSDKVNFVALATGRLVRVPSNRVVHNYIPFKQTADLELERA